jgi:predicted phage terminase large subunit-like protein
MIVQGPSTLNPHFSPKELESQRKRLPPLVFEQEILGRFVQIDSGLLRREDIKLSEAPALEQFLTLSLGLDFALTEKKSSDFSAAVLAGVAEDKRTFILKSEKWRAAWPRTFQRVVELYELFRPHIVLTESVAFSELCVRELAASGVPIDAIKPSTDKIARFSPVAMRYRMGMIYHSLELPQELEDELIAFPSVEHDDQVDALVYAVSGLDQSIRSAWGELSSGHHWSPLPHERKKQRWWGKVDGRDQWFECGPETNWQIKKS